MLVLPGPGLVIIAAGLALLATEYDWVARLLMAVRQRVVRLGQQLRARLSGQRQEQLLRGD
jgi:putative transmembrane protein PGPGW